ncbi:MAG: phospho-2-dehydro-3-deoxyheptonate aldolase (Phospho-2-keto-3-deoxyheptonate aldolase) [Deltaproteobacteria bacterium CSP1-8]|nr:MAG: phospho-2-dehydro-3-deoxyheptonate aldolase (Phospho-2-keto-3-deoxyheptonate aldolase) [Deltaproteobacteria bacterium CSP1-8]
MIIVLKAGATGREIALVEEKIRAYGLTAHISRGVERTIIGAIGDERKMQPEAFEGMECVEKVLRILKPYKIVSRDFQKEDTVITVRGQTIGGGTVALIAGPCAVEGREMMLGIGARVASSGASFLRGGAFKPRTSPYAFLGLGEEGLRYLAEAREATGLPVATELMDPRDIDLVVRYADVIQIGARNMQNFRLLTEVGRLDKPVILKRGMSATIMEWLMSAEYIASEGNRKIILCERGVRTFESATRNTFDVSAIPVLKGLSHLPVIADPSHAAGKMSLVEPLAAAAIAAGADGVMVEVHHDPETALSDGPQSLRPDAFQEMVARLKGIAAAVGKKLGNA